MSRIRADKYTNREGTGAPAFTDGLVVGTGTSIKSPAANTLIFDTNSVERVRITSAGLVGIGTDDPDELLEVGNGTVFGALKVSGQSSSVTSDGLTVDWESSSNSTRIFSEPSSGGSSAIRLFTANSGTRAEALRIDNAGRVLKGWGSTTFDGPSNSVDIAVAGTSSNNGIQVGRYNTSYGAYALTIFRSRGTSVGTNLPTLSNDDIGHITWWGDDGTNWRDVAEITGACDGNTDSSSSPGKIIFKTTKDGATDSTQAMTIKANHNVEIHDGNIVFETAGNGIDFSATSDGPGAVSEILQDYEEGEWTPNIVGSTSGTAAASSAAGSGGWYVRVGNTVWLSFYFANPTITGTMSGSLRLNLPFTNANNDRFDNGGGGNVTYTRDFKSGDNNRRITLNVDQGLSYARFKTLYDNSTSETADLTQTMAGLVSSTLIKGNIIMIVDT